MQPTLQISEIITLIRQAWIDVYKAANTHLINLNWNIGEYITNRTKSEGWEKSTVLELALFIQTQEPGAQGFSDKNLWRMR